MKKVTRFLKDESGATAIEYALLAGLMGVGVAAAAGTLTGGLSTMASNISAKLSGFSF